MGNIFAIYKPILHGLMKLAGLRPQTLEIEPGTVMNFWVPTETNSKKSKPAVVFLHGFAVDGIMTWQFQVLSLARYYAVYVPDLIFFGGSITDKPHRSPEFQAECVAKGLRKLGVERCTLVGLSYGGMVGFKMAELYPDLVEAFVVTCSVMALNKSVSDAGLGRIGFSRWSDYLLPDSVKGVRNIFEIAAYKFPHLPDWVYRHYLEAMFDNRREREELLEALVISDEDFTVANYPQSPDKMKPQDDSGLQANSIQKGLTQGLHFCPLAIKSTSPTLFQLEKPPSNIPTVRRYQAYPSQSTSAEPRFCVLCNFTSRWLITTTSRYAEFAGAVPTRPAQDSQDLAFSVSRFIQNGGSFANYYMYHEGTNFGRTANMRVYLLWGANDKIFDIESASNLNKQLGNNASVYHIEKAGHLVQMERPFVYNSQLKKFLASLSEDVHQD